MLGKLFVEHGLDSVAVVGCLQVRVEGAGADSSVLASGFGLKHVLSVDTEAERYWNLPAAVSAFQRLLVCGVDVAVEGHAFPEVGDVSRRDAPAVAYVASEPGDSVGGEEGEAVSVAELQLLPLKHEFDVHGLRRLAPYSDDLAHGFAYGLGGVHRGPLATFSVQEKFGEPPVERFRAVRPESAPDDSERSSGVKVRMP